MLVIPGHLDFQLIPHFERLFNGRKITWLVEENALHDPSLRAYLEKSGSGAMFSVDDAAPAAAGNQLRAYLTDGGVLIFVPGRATTRKATACHIPAAQLKVLCAFSLPVLPVAIDLPRTSGMSIESKASLPAAVIAIGKPIAPERASISSFQQSLLEANEEAYSLRSLLQGSLAMALLQGLKKHGSKKRILDGADDTGLTFDKVLAAAIVLSKFIQQETDKPRVAIVLPPGKGGLIANLAVLFAGKVPVNLNFTAGHEAIKSCIRQADVDRFITADPFVRRVSSFPWPPNRDLIFIERVLPTLKPKIVRWAILCKLLPASVLGLMLGLNHRRGEDEATLLFTSGSSGEPKGVVLSHRNVLANVCQFGSRLDLPNGSSILGCLPLFHSFGSTVTLWFPIIEGIDLVTYPSPLETKRLAELIALAKAQPGKVDFASTGAGGNPHLFADLFMQLSETRMNHVPYKGNADLMTALLGGHVMAGSDASGWDKYIDSGQMRLLATFGEKRTKRWPNVPTLTELGYDTLSDSPFGIGAPRDMAPAVTQRLHDAFKKALEDPVVLATFDKYDQSVIYMNSADYTQFARDNYAKEKTVIERLGLAAKPV